VIVARAKDGRPEGLDEARAALLDRLLAQVEDEAESYEILLPGAGLEIRKAALEDRPAGRPRILLFPADRGRLVAFFYKPSRLSFSRDRFSYGALYLYAARPEEAAGEFATALAYLADDFKPAAKPPRLKRSLDVTVPEAP
jgi:hypothetical protein